MTNINIEKCLNGYTVDVKTGTFHTDHYVAKDKTDLKDVLSKTVDKLE